MTSSIQVIGIVGSNLLASMMCLEAKKRGIKTILLEPEINNVTSDFADSHLTAEITKESVERLAYRVDVILFCGPNIPRLDKTFVENTKIYPTREGMDLIRSKIDQLIALPLCGIPTPQVHDSEDKETFFDLLEDIEKPCKVYQFYDDEYDLMFVSDDESMEDVKSQFNDDAYQWLIEEVSAYERIVSVTVLVASKKIYMYPYQQEELESQHLKLISMPAKLTKNMEQKLSKFIRTLFKEVKCEGLYNIKYGIKKDRSVELIDINAGSTIGDIATNHYTDYSVYEQYLNLIEGKPLKAGELTKACKVMVTTRDGIAEEPEFPYHEYILDRCEKNPIKIFVKAEEIE